MKKQRICPLSGQAIPEGAHGNRKYFPSETVEKQRKGRNNHTRFEKISTICNIAIGLDKILGRHYPHSAGKTPIDRSILGAFDWDFITKISDTMPPIFWILNYGYSFNNTKDKIVIHYDPNNT
ncbi:MAG: hypothetical protein HOP10_03000 [Chitinophagaceae bacterium]|nr:hypothetical protein [Chitinophagaceae bacterium]